MNAASANPPNRLRIAMAQVNPTMGDIAGNRALIETTRRMR